MKPYFLTACISFGLALTMRAQVPVISTQEVEVEPIKISLAVPFCAGYEPKELAKKKLAPVQAAAVEYYQGLLLGLDSLQKLGFQFRLNVYDTQKDSLSTLKIFSNPTLVKSDLIIGPFFKEGIEMASAFCVKNKIYHIAPTTSVSLKNQDPWLISPNTELPNYAEQIALYISKTDSIKDFIFLNDGKRQSKLFAESFRKIADSLHLNVKWVQVDKDIPTGLVSKNNQKICVIFPTSSELLSIKLLKSLPDSMPGIRVVGCDAWLDFKTTDFRLWEKCRVYIATNSYVDYSDADVVRFVMNFRNKFGAEPGLYAFKAWDQFMSMAQGWYVNPNDWKAHPEQWGNNNGLASHILFKRDPRTGSINNTSIRLLRFENYKLAWVY